MNKKYLAYSLSLLALASCGKKEDEQKKNAAPPPTPVTLVAAHTTEAVYYDEYPATVVALNTVELRSQATGFVTGVYFKEGDVVPKGKLLYEIDQRQYQAAYQQALADLRSVQANAANAEVNAGRYQRLAQQDAVARQLVDNANTAAATARAQVAAAQASVNIARNNLGFSRVTAPFTGRIGISEVRLGSQVGAGTTLLNTISSEDPMGVDIVVTQTDIERFIALQNAKTSRADSTLRLVLPGGVTYPQPGRIRTIDRGVNSQTGTITVRVEFANPKRELKDGMSAVVKVLNTQSGQRLVVPFKAIVEQMGENFVYVATDSSTAQQRKVTLGPRLKDQIVLMNGVKDGDKVVTEGVQKLRDGGKITTEVPKAPPAAPGK
ncbi:efflux RND transporter periplasmic adaptor subunit [Hymenobacter properus]|uniref:Efflux RND transporter periplasmic adaptor subunit n=1 Tax=Hymenobacter properus TaxID=2791026 RepID=A0A931BLJ5_9BACT|nr:efflux RND transporter periplasmic adaptor subunit [Hymenobacter properus]MBF9143591.1 efflux RND transporter periplasmic adaptor subunit [Hymenobacter properus]MBR7722404.1 efflux RND transporter periplasmic adaptor subunit [Microvirga sp. SRT04]